MLQFNDSERVDVVAELLGAEVLNVVDVTVLKRVVEEDAENVVDEEVDEAPPPTGLLAGLKKDGSAKAQNFVPVDVEVLLRVDVRVLENDEEDEVLVEVWDLEVVVVVVREPVTEEVRVVREMEVVVVTVVVSDEVTDNELLELRDEVLLAVVVRLVVEERLVLVDVSVTEVEEENVIELDVEIVAVVEDVVKEMDEEMVVVVEDVVKELDEESVTVIVLEDVVAVLSDVDDVDVAVARLKAVGQWSGSMSQSPGASSQQQKRAQPVLGTGVEQVDPPTST
mmetsp:Transcript_38778/g.79445  ORF Transcript_38778/g.79445 Transcript_38778/m.79445 type:complete len:281 (+) Transcript_38778:115-957(+)